MNLAEIRKERKITQRELADLSHLTQQSISAYEKGITLPSLSVAIKLATILNCSLDDLLLHQKVM